MGRHLVARQIIEIITADRRDAEVLMARTSAAAPALAAAIERTLDAFDAGHRIRLDTVEIDLGRCDPAQWETALVTGVERALAAQLPRSTARDDGTTAGPTSKTQAAMQLLAEFARSGRLPWWAGAADTPAPAVAVLLAGDAAPEAVRSLLALPGAIERFVRQLDPESLAALAALAAIPRPENLRRTVAALTAQIAAAAYQGGATIPEAWRTALHRIVLGEPAEPPRTSVPRLRPEQAASALSGQPAPGAAADALSGQPAPGAAADALSYPSPLGESPGDKAPAGGATAADPERALRAARHDRSPAALAARLAALARERPAWSALLTHLAGLAEALDESMAATAPRAFGGLSGAAALAELIATLAGAGHVERDAADRWLQALAAVALPADPHEAIAVDDAGLPLLWPFLPTFFDGLELLDDRGFRDEPARHRAVSLLHYLASGEPTAPEPRLPLAKLLAGLHPDALHIPGNPLGQAEIDAGEALLAAVLDHAPMLGRISIDGLRASFLLRPGTLATRDGHWLLRVERQSFDILLDRLPWPLSWARLPWMTAALQIEW